MRRNIERQHIGRDRPQLLVNIQYTTREFSAQSGGPTRPSSPEVGRGRAKCVFTPTRKRRVWSKSPRMIESIGPSVFTPTGQSKVGLVSADSGAMSPDPRPNPTETHKTRRCAERLPERNKMQACRDVSRRRSARGRNTTCRMPRLCAGVVSETPAWSLSSRCRSVDWRASTSLAASTTRAVTWGVMAPSPKPKAGLDRKCSLQGWRSKLGLCQVSHPPNSGLGGSAPRKFPPSHTVDRSESSAATRWERSSCMPSGRTLSKDTVS